MEKFKQELQGMVVRIKKLFELIRKEENILSEEKSKIYILPSDTKHLKLLHEIILKFHYQILSGEIPYESFNCCELPKDKWKAFQKLCWEIGLKARVVKIHPGQMSEEEVLTIELL